MRTAVLLLISEVLLILAVILVCTGLHGNVGFNFGWPLSQFVFTANVESRGAPVAIGTLLLLISAVTLVAGIVGLIKQPKTHA